MPSSSSSPSNSSNSDRHSSSSSNYTITHHAQMERTHNTNEGGSSSAASVNLEILSREEARQTIVASLVQILEQPLAMLRDGTVGDQQMKAESRLIPGSSLGKHLRHVHDHYRVLLDSIESSKRKGGEEAIELDYDKRTRVVPLETSGKVALEEFESTIERIQKLFNQKQSQDTFWDLHLDRPIRLFATTPAEIELGSSLGREMWFVCLHAIHHYALARVILVHELGLRINDSFGVAPSTMVMRLWRQASSQEKSKL